MDKDRNETRASKCHKKVAVKDDHCIDALFLLKFLDQKCCIKIFSPPTHDRRGEYYQVIYSRAQPNCNIDFLITGNWLNEPEFEGRSYCGHACDCNANIVPLLMCGLRPYPVYQCHPRRSIRCTNCLRMNERYRFIGMEDYSQLYFIY